MSKKSWLAAALCAVVFAAVSAGSAFVGALTPCSLLRSSSRSVSEADGNQGVVTPSYEGVPVTSICAATYGPCVLQRSKL
jgi:hypothetical protein